MRSKKGQGSFLVAAVTILATMLMIFAGVFAWIMVEQDGASYIDTIAAVLFPPRELDKSVQKASASTPSEELYNIEVNGAVTHSAAGSYNDATINSGGVVLKNKTVLGDLIISSKVGRGEVTLEDMVVRGSIIVKGGAKLTMKNVTAITVNAENSSSTEYFVSGKTTVNQLNVGGPVTIDESGLEKGYYGIRKVAAQNSEMLKKVTLKAGTIEQTVKAGNKK